MTRRLNPEETNQCRELIGRSSRIVITTHKSPDGDAVGSALGLWNLLKNQGKNAVVIFPDHAPEFLQWMAGYDRALDFSADNVKAENVIREAELIFSLDYNHLGRTGKEMEAVLRSSPASFILIDHHQQPEGFAEVTYSDTSSCSTAQLIYCFMDSLGWKSSLNKAVAECLYCGIMTDSGSFRFPSVTPETHHIAAELMELGLDHARVHEMVYDTNLQDRLRLIGYALNEKLEVIPESAAAMISLSQEELTRFNYRPGDTEGLVNQALSIKGIKVAAFFREGGNEIKVSFRSKGGFDVNQFARQSWNGGGHRNAAGGSTTESLDQALERFRLDMARLKHEIAVS